MQLGEVGSTGVATAISQGMDVDLFWTLEDIAAAEALVARNGSGINTIADLKGKKVGTPFVFTLHFQLLYAMQQAGLKPADVQVLNMRPPEIAAAWGRGDIDATFIWDPVLSNVKKTGKVLMTSGDICKKGACTFDGLIVTKKFARRIRNSWSRWSRRSPMPTPTIAAMPRHGPATRPKVAAVAKWSGAKPEDVPDAMALYELPEPAEQASPAWLGGGANGAATKALAQQANFLKEQGRSHRSPGLQQERHDRVGDEGDKVASVASLIRRRRAMRRRFSARM